MKVKTSKKCTGNNAKSDVSSRYSFLEKLLQERHDTVVKLSIETSVCRIMQLTEAVKSIDKTIAEWAKE